MATQKSIMLKPVAGDCNLQCGYCYYRRNSSLYGNDAHRMSEDVLEQAVKQYMELEGQYKPVSFQGGEPLLAGLDFFQRALALEQKYAHPGAIIENNLQTNGILLDDKWAQFFHENQILTGISLDGPEKVHNKFRKDFAGQGTYKQVMRAIAIMKKHQAEYNILCVVAKHNVHMPYRLFRFFIDKGLKYLQLIPCVERGDNGYADFSIIPTEYGEFLCRIFDAYVSEDNPAIYERTIDAVLHCYLGMKPPFCIFGKECDRLLTIEYNGDVYPCDFFVQPKWRLGNILTESLQDLSNGPVMQLFAAETSKMPQECQECQWFPVCHGGCSRYREMLQGSFTDPQYFCQSYSRLFTHAFTTLAKLEKKRTSKIGYMLAQKRLELAH